jgi:lipopolysaccharide export LptBFGC system permease protein LptF
MSQPENLGSFFSENKKLVSDYIETRIALLKLQSVRTVSKAAGTLIWSVVAILFVFIIMIFAGLVLGFWFSDLTGSYMKGFGFATLVFIVLFMLITLLRKTLFVNPMIQKIIAESTHKDEI